MGIFDSISEKLGIKSITNRMPEPKKDFVDPAGALSNEPIAYVETPYGVFQPISYLTMWSYFKDSPEAIACINALIEDIMSNGWTLEGEKADVEKAEEFLEKNYARNQIRSMLYDAFVTGDGYVYMKKLNEREMKSRISGLCGPLEMKSQFVNQVMMEIKQEDPDILSTKSFRYIPSSTVWINYNINGDIIKYVQRVGSQFRWFDTPDIMHFRLMDIDGKVYGYTPMQSILRELDILANVKDLAKYYFEKGGVPNYMFILKNETPDSATAKAFKKNLQLFANVQNKYKNMIVCGDVEAKELNKLNKDMEYRELARYITQVIVNVFGVPATRLPGLLMDSGMKGALSSEGYYRKIEHWQQTLSDLLNYELLKGYNVKLKFNRTYRQDDIRESQANKVNADTALQLFNAGIVNDEWVWNTLSIKEDFRGDMEPINQAPNTNQQDLINNHQQLSQSEDKLKMDKDKQASALNLKAMPAELEMGIAEEMEHTSSREEAMKIALDHLKEIPDYYTRLKKMKEDAKKSKV